MKSYSVYKNVNKQTVYPGIAVVFVLSLYPFFNHCYFPSFNGDNHFQTCFLYGLFNSRLLSPEKI